MLALVYYAGLRVIIVHVDHEGYAVLVIAASLLVVLDDERGEDVAIDRLPPRSALFVVAYTS